MNDHLPPLSPSAKIPSVAIIGSGGIAQVHAKAIMHLQDQVRLAAVCSRNAEAARALAVPHGAEVFSSLEELLRTGSAEALLVATPSGAHREAVIPALRAGWHVLCEKPLEISVARAREILEEAKKAGRTLAGFFPLRCGHGALKLKEAAEAGRFGRLTFLSARVKWWREAAYYSDSSWRGTWQLDGGGALMNQGIHALDLLQWIGGAPQEVCAYAATLAHKGLEVEDTLAAGLRFSHGALGTIEAATSCHPGLDFSLEVSGDRGTATLLNDRIADWRFADAQPGDDDVRKIGYGGIAGGTASPAIGHEGHRRQIEAFCRAIQGGNDPIIDGREAARAVAIAEAVYRSARSGKSEAVESL